MAYTTIKKPSLHFNTKTYTGTGASQSITGVGFQPDLNWTKDRDATENHSLTDAVRGATKRLFSNINGAESINVASLTSFDSDGFTVGGAGTHGTNGNNYVSWNWKANGTGVSNTDGSITSTVSANTTSGFSIVSYSGNGNNGATVGHGLGVAPKAVIVKARTTANTQNWFVNYPFGTGDGYIMLNRTNAGDGANSTVWNSTAPDASTVTLGTTSAVNDATYDYIMYCFAEKKGFSKFGSYTGNGNADGTFVYTGFKPAFVMLKVSSTINDWIILDNKRDTFNVATKKLLPNESNAESSDLGVSTDFLSNGFKFRTTGNNVNASGATYIYMAFAEEPLVGDNPATAR